MIETLDDIIEEILNRLYIYDQHDEEKDTCNCRSCQASSLRIRILDAVALKDTLDKQRHASALNVENNLTIRSTDDLQGRN